jgi:hypothetical protein
MLLHQPLREKGRKEDKEEGHMVRQCNPNTGLNHARGS